MCSSVLITFSLHTYLSINLCLSFYPFLSISPYHYLHLPLSLCFSLTNYFSLSTFFSVLNSISILGIVGLQDPLREGVVEAVHRIRDSGAKVCLALHYCTTPLYAMLHHTHSPIKSIVVSSKSLPIFPLSL